MGDISGEIEELFPAEIEYTVTDDDHF